MTKEQQTIAELALGRILRLGSRPAQLGDVADYVHNWARDRNKGAQGD